MSAPVVPPAACAAVSAASAAVGGSSPRRTTIVAPPFRRVRLRRPAGSVVPRTTTTNTGDVVHIEGGGAFVLGERIASGGEGSIFHVNEAFVAKIYHHDRLTTGQVRKLRRMVERPMGVPWFAWPLVVLANGHGEPVGFLMRRVRGRELFGSVFTPRRSTDFPTWTRRELVALAFAVALRVQRLHAAGVVVGDLNARNVLVEDADHVVLVDCDSFQIEGHVCPVGTTPYVAPELVGVDLATTLRTPEHDAFALATLLFMILLPGKAPYAHVGGTDPTSNVVRQRFPYPHGTHAADGVPPGPWLAAWSHLPDFIRGAFVDAFVRGERPTAAAWVDLLLRYSRDLAVGGACADIFPNHTHVSA